MDLQFRVIGEGPGHDGQVGLAVQHLAQHVLRDVDVDTGVDLGGVLDQAADGPGDEALPIRRYGANHDPAAHALANGLGRGGDPV
nr:hypothetical protein [Caulobacter ginsengisoli]